MRKTKLAVVGLGKIARDQHLPAIAASGPFELAGIASPEGEVPGVPRGNNLAELLDTVPTLEAVSLCTPPQVRYEAARFALEHGLHVLLEKPPCVTVSEVLALTALARKRRVALLAGWHSRYAPAIEPARVWAAGQRLRTATVTWKEDVRIWHPGQNWIWKAGGLGVFDPGINALSILTHIIPDPLALKKAELRFPRNSETPIAARLELETAEGIRVAVELDFLHSGPQQWDINLAAESGHCEVSLGGKEMRIDGHAHELPDSAEYPGLYARFATLIRGRGIDADFTPLQLVADAFLSGRQIEVDPYVDESYQC
jgi:D-galactose 1-dehydrogenase